MQAIVKPLRTTFKESKTLQLFLVAILITLIFYKACNNSDIDGSKPKYHFTASGFALRDTTPEQYQKLYMKFNDSLASHTSLQQFGKWIYKNATAYEIDSTSFDFLYTVFLNQQYQIWLRSKQKK